VAGLDPRRFHIVAAVTARAAGHERLLRSELFGASAGGVRIDDPGADLAIAAALASASRGVPPPEATAFVGEVSLTGAVRPVAGMEQRVSAAGAGGISRVMCAPWGGAGEARRPRSGGGPELALVRHIRDALTWAFVRND